MKGYLLDTNICIFALRNEYGIIERMKQCGEANCFVADVTVMELRYGAYNSNKSQENLVAVNNFLKKVKTVPFAESIDIFCQEKVRLKKLGKKLEDFVCTRPHGVRIAIRSVVRQSMILGGRPT